jgi:prolipoprotein diacylglyceryltransferase
MYPNLYYACKDLFGISIPALRFINSFGFFVALSFICAAVTLSRELLRKEREGLLQGKDVTVLIGKPASPGELLVNFILGFLLGFKIVGLFISNSPLTANPQDFIMSFEGSWPAGILLGLLFAGLKWWERNKLKQPEPQEKKIRIWPHDRVGDLTIFAAIFGFLGAKVFNSLETWDDFVKDPLGSLFSFSGLTFYGGLICAALAIWYYARKHNIGFWYLNDAAAPGLMLAYAVGRIGCQVAGDGDWGILNSAYITKDNSKPVAASIDAFHSTLAANQAVYLRPLGSFDSLAKVPHLSIKAPSWLPDWFFAYSYPHNVVNEGVRIPGCTDASYCSHLPIPVFPTPFYETVVCLLLFWLLWSLRKKLKVPGYLFAIYLLVNGFERFFIEKIRVNTKYNFLSFLGFQPTQAEIISFLLFVAGILLLVFLRPKKAAPDAHPIP